LWQAISFLEKARSNRPNDRRIAISVQWDRCPFFMSEPRLSLVSNDPATAEKRYRSALQIRPGNGDAAAGLQAAEVRAVASSRVVALRQPKTPNEAARQAKDSQPPSLESERWQTPKPLSHFQPIATLHECSSHKLLRSGTH
jgi:hypothetical protein